MKQQTDQNGKARAFWPDRAGSFNYIFLGLLFAVCMKTILKACGPAEDGSFMHCHTAEQSLFILALVIAAAGVASLFAKGALRKAIALAEFMLAFVGLLLPGTLISLCMMPDMRCRSVMRPGALVFCVLVIAASAIDIIRLFRRKESGDRV